MASKLTFRFSELFLKSGLTPEEKEVQMLNRKFFMVVLVIVFVSLINLIPAGAGDVEKININTATAEELMQLHGVGPKYAANIIAYREKYGPFKMPEDLMQVSGIGQGTFETNQDIIITAETPKN
ncbi:MAG: helix-hairpin-helix domain-containing protein [Desulfobacterales bacterium]|jgi:competence protein ComEA